MRQVILIAAKDLRIEARGRQTISLVIVLGILIVVVLGMGLGAGRPVSGFAATAILWVAYLFGGVLCFEKTMAVERHDDALAGLLLAPVDRGAIFAAKLLTNVLLMFSLAAVVTPVAILLFRFDLSAHPLGFATIMALGMVGFAAVGTLFAAAVSSTRLEGGLLALLVFPLSLPVVIVSTQMMRRLFEQGEPLGSTGLATLVAFDVLFLVVSWVVFELVLEP
ncbi:MAG: heme exporter protein CcmB [Planctomycetota bacterium]|nr:heme exporter protein CcmB [Planctomycetota bacterium]